MTDATAQQDNRDQNPDTNPEVENGQATTVDGGSTTDSSEQQPVKSDTADKSVKELSSMSQDELDKLLEEDESEENKKTPAEETPSESSKEDESDGESTEEGGKVPSIPKPRLDEVLNKSKTIESENLKLRERVAYLEGVAKGGGVKLEDSPEADAKTVAKQDIGRIDKSLKTLETNHEKKIDELAKKLDDDVITQVQYNQEVRKLNREVDTLRTKLNEKRVSLQRQVDSPSVEEVRNEIINNPELRAATDKLYEANPWLKQLDDDTIAAFQGQALGMMQAAAQKKGQQLYDDIETNWQLRQLTVELARKYAKSLGVDLDKKAANGSASAQPNVTAQERKDKIKLADSVPPTLTKAGTPDSSGMAISEERVQNMSVQELSKLSQEELDKFL